MTKTVRQPAIRKFVWLIEKTDDWINVSVAIALLFIAIALLAATVYKAIVEKSSDIFVMTHFVVDHLLLVLIILEILWTIITYLESHKVPLEPFLYVGIITSIRKLLVIGANVDFSNLNKNLSMIASEVGLNTGVIIVLVFGLYLVRKSRVLYLQRKEPDCDTQSENNKRGER